MTRQTPFFLRFKIVESTRIIFELRLAALEVGDDQAISKVLCLPVVRHDSSSWSPKPCATAVPIYAFSKRCSRPNSGERNLIERRLRGARLPLMKTLEDFAFARNRKVSVLQLQERAQGSYIERAEPNIFIGDSGTGKTHLLTGLAVAACRQKRRVRFTTAVGLVNELVEAKHQLRLGRVLARWARYDLIALDEDGYVPLAEVGAEFLFQVVAERAEKAAVILTTNLPFSEWTQVIPNARLCKALVDRITDRAHIVETGTCTSRAFGRSALCFASPARLSAHAAVSDGGQLRGSILH